jgi:magnesium-transporting ATPase (P-type)
MNWYQIFYWISVADNVKRFFDFTSNAFTILCIVSFVVYVLTHMSMSERPTDKEKQSVQYWGTNFRKLFIWFTIFSFISWMGYIFIPTKKDALIIVAGGAVGEFITSDSSSKQIPYELTSLLREKIKSEISEIRLTGDLSVDTLKEKTKEELIEMIKNNGVSNK